MKNMANKFLVAGSLVLMLLVVGLPAQAATVTVGCPGAAGGPFDFTSMNDALASLHAISHRNHQINVTGVCAEAIVVDDFENLRIIGSGGATFSDPGAATPAPNLVIIRSRNVHIEGVTLRGAGDNGRTLSIVTHSFVTFNLCAFEQASHALFLNEADTVSVTQSTFQDNVSAIRVSGSWLRLGSPDGDPTPTVIQRNGSGIQVDENAMLGLNSSTTVRDQQGFGVQVLGGRLRLCCNGQIEVTNNEVGIDVQYGSVDMIGGALIEGNRVAGLRLVNGSASLTGGQTFRQNGSGPLTQGGIVARGNSHVEAGEITVSNNNGSGIVLRDTSSASLFGAQVTGNTRDGLLVVIQSTAGIFGANLTGNAGADLRCSPDSFAYGGSTIGRSACPRFAVEPLPGP